jgi:hypothetical protein
MERQGIARNKPQGLSCLQFKVRRYRAPTAGRSR